MYLLHRDKNCLAYSFSNCTTVSCIDHCYCKERREHFQMLQLLRTRTLHQYVMCEMCTALVPRWSNWHNWPQPIQKPNISIRSHKCYSCFYPCFSFIPHNLCFITFRISVTQEMSATAFIYVTRLPLRANCCRTD